MPNTPDGRRTTAIGTSGGTVELGPAHGVMEDAAGNRFNFTITVASSGPRVVGPPPRFRFELTGPDETTTSVEMVFSRSP